MTSVVMVTTVVMTVRSGGGGDARTRGRWRGASRQTCAVGYYQVSYFPYGAQGFRSGVRDGVADRAAGDGGRARARSGSRRRVGGGAGAPPV